MSSIIKKTAFLSRPTSTVAAIAVGSQGTGIFWRALLLAPLLLTGCTDNPASSRFSQAVQMVIPETKIVDYRTLSCDVLWDLDDKETLENSLYWLRAMDCAERLGSTQARALAKTLPVATWSAAFKQGILISSAEPSMAERRQVVERLNSYSQTIPGAVRPLIQLWREQQVLRISLAEERIRYQRLQDESDAQIDRLRESQVRLQYNLLDTTRKLENLTDIERQLSSRKQLQNEIPETDAESKPAAAAPKATEAKPQPKVEPAKPVEAKPIEAKPVETKPAEAKAIEVKPVEAKPVETKPTEAKPVEAKPIESKPIDVKPAAPQPEVKSAAPLSAAPSIEKPADTPPVVPPTDASPATNKESHDATQTGQSTAG
ncbi:two-component system QseEF-associated lipoprotein QseG [Yersinia mollaretii]|uniref:two-component system QseEF-associated lipoprotein QseG n=1 Tax=Yersinia mollaretii TaxID=33060 RepID=UPI001E3EA6BB|nr:two-component system QseEF-associated lipoprotein QseG [Yersinia mollaretii]MDA5527740.1 two-component system QseEF-associated lipoprotein QseG [Yersinia mollaretii]MDR7873901.1 two-component system QseEF-associated lipoprotein QseG [Yersinia mollaretii]WQC77135.1 two-component system QseEF-associated lipoprotein QseG [Yersinia mollaretii]